MNLNGPVTHDFGVEGIYTIRIQGDFPSIQFNNGGDKDKIVDIAQWGNIEWESFENAFQGCSNLNSTASDAPDLSKAGNMSFAFQLASQFNGDISNWDVSSVKNMRGMFWGANALDRDLSNWNTAIVTDMAFMFFGATLFDSDLTNWNVESVTLMSSMFSGTNNFNGDLSNWNPLNVIDMSFMFSNASSFNQNLGIWNISSVTDMTGMLSNTNLSIENYDNTLVGWAGQAPQNNVILGAMGLEYCGGESARTDLINTYNWTITDDSKNCPYFIIQFDTSLPGTSNGSSVELPTIGGNYSVDWDNDGLFDDHNLSGNTIHDFGAPGIYTIMIKGDFPRIYFNNSGDKDKLVSVIQWGDNPWTTMKDAFHGCNNFVIVAPDSPNLTNVSDMSSMFRDASNFNGFINNWDVSNVTDMSNMFRGASSFNSQLSNWNLSSVENMAGMFRDATTFNQSIGNWNITSCLDMTNMLSDCGMSMANYDNTLIGWSLQNVQANVNLDAQNLKYCEGEAARTLLINQNGWSISGDEKACPFISTWRTNNPGITNASSVAIPTFPGETYNYDVDWENDGIYDDFGVSGDITHDYGNPGTYDIAIRGQFPRIYFNSQGDEDKIIDVLSWGGIEWSSMKYAFYGCSNLDVSATDAPDLSNLTDIHGMFIGTMITDPDFTNWDVSTVTHMGSLFLFCQEFTGDVSNWDVSNVVDMKNTFGWAQAFNGNISNWDVSNVTDMSGMFEKAYDFNMAIGGWDVSNVTNMYRMFGSAFDFNQSIDSWDVSNVETMDRMFESADAFTQDLNSWDVSNVTNMDAMFIGAELFNGAIGNWDVSNVTDMAQMFAYTPLFNQDLNQWDVSSVTNMGQMFYNAESFNGNISAWDVTNVTSMYFMFANSAFNQDLNTWDVSNVQQFSSMFQDNIHFNGDISNWDVTGTSNLSDIFRGATSFNRDISGWDVSNATHFGFMFNNAQSFDQDLSSWDVTNATYMGFMFNNSGVSTGNYDKILISWASQNVQDDVWLGASGLTYCKGESARLNLILNKGWSFQGDDKDCAFTMTWKTDNPGVSPNDAITIPTIGGGYNYDVDWNNDGTFDQFGINGSTSYIFAQPGTYTIRIRGDFPRIHFNDGGDKEKIIDIEQWGDIEWQSMENAFYGCYNLDISATDPPDLSNVTNMSSMMKVALSFNGDVSDWDVSNVTDMSGLFAYAENFEGDVSSWDVSNVTDMSDMFWVVDNFNSDLSNWDVSNVTSTSGMFGGNHIFNSDISGWDVSKVTDMSQMFAGAESFNQDISGWDISNVTSIWAMFKSADAFNIDIGGWDVSGVSSLAQMFWGAEIFNQDISGWDISNVSNLTSMFRGAYAFNQDISNWNTANVDDISAIFSYTNSFNQDLSDWDMSNVTDMSYAFQFATAFDQSLEDWDVSAATDMTDMLSSSGLSQENYDQSLIGWADQAVQANVTLDSDNLNYCAGEMARNHLTNSHGWSISGDNKTCPSAFLTTWKTDNPGTSNASSITIPASGPGLKYHIDWENDGIYDEVNVTGAITHDYGNPGTYTVAIIGSFPRIAFNNVGDKEKILFINQWSDQEWSTMQNAFFGCSNLKITALDSPNFSNVESTASMLRGATAFNSGISGWDMSNVVNTTFMFAEATSFNQSLNSWDMSQVENLSYMFYNASDFNGDVTNWNVSNVVNMYGTFWNASSFNRDITTWNTQSVEDMRKTFQNATDFNQDLGAWDIADVTQMNSMLEFSGLSMDNYDNTLIGWAGQNVQNNVQLDADDLLYCAAQTERDFLINTKGWTIQNDILGCAPCGVNTWIGGVDVWGKATLWDLNRVPMPCDDVVIPIGGDVTVSSNKMVTIKSLLNNGIVRLLSDSKMEIMPNE